MFDGTPRKVLVADSHCVLRTLNVEGNAARSCTFPIGGPLVSRFNSNVTFRRDEAPQDLVPVPDLRLDQTISEFASYNRQHEMAMNYRRSG